MPIRFLTAGESHGKGIVVILEGLQKGLKIDKGFIDSELKRRQGGYGRGKRMSIERDEIEIMSGVRFCETLGSPVAIVVNNKDWVNWQDEMAIFGLRPKKEGVCCPRPGHADLAGGLKYNEYDLRNILERASARETAARVVVGGVCKLFLRALGVNIMGHVLSIGRACIDYKAFLDEYDWGRVAGSPVYCMNPNTEKAMIEEIERARVAKDTLGGVAEVRAMGVLPGLGNHVHWDRKMDGQLASALMSIHAIKAVEIGQGIQSVYALGSSVHDAIYYEQEKGFFRKTNRSGGLEGGITTGEDVVVRTYMKPIATLMTPLDSVHVRTKEPMPAQIERSDVCAVPAMCVVAEAMVAYVLANAYIEKFGGDYMDETISNVECYKARLRLY